MRSSRALSDCFDGLEEGEDRYSLVLLAKKAGKLAGFTPRAIDLLEYYVAFTTEHDWAGQGAGPIVFQSVTKTALDLGVSERQVQKLEAVLFAAGAITWRDSGNHKRYGRRCPDTGRLVFAFGVDLSPLAQLREPLERLLEEKRRADEAWLETKRQISWYRRQVRGLLLEAEQRGHGSLVDHSRRYDAIAIQIRTHLDLDALHALLEGHKRLHNDLLALVGGEGTSETEEAPQRGSVAKETGIGSCKNEPEFAHYRITNQRSSDESDTGSRLDAGCRESVAGGPLHQPPAPSAGVEHVTLKQVVAASSDRFRSFLPLDPESIDWRDFIDGAERLRRELGVSQASWGEACQALGRTGAALCVLVTDRGALREEDPVRQPTAYFRSLINRARRGELRLHNSIFGLLGRSQRPDSSSSISASSFRPTSQRR